MLPRFPADFRVRIATIEGSRPRIVHARANDLGTGGINVSLPQEIIEGSLAMIGFRMPQLAKNLPPETVFWLRAQLQHRRGFRCGFQFVDVTTEQKLFLRHLCRMLPQSSS